MLELSDDGLHDLLARIYREESRRILATLIRLLGDFDRAEEALHEAFRAALEQWPRDGVPNNPRTWLISAGRFKAIDAIRRHARFDAALPTIARQLADEQPDQTRWYGEGLADDQLRLIFACCHTAIAPEARVALTLREVCGLTTEAIARAFRVQPSTLAQRIVRAKAKLRHARRPFLVPAPAELPDRLEAVLQVIYLVFNEGYAPAADTAPTRPELSAEAIRLGRLLLGLLPRSEVMGLLALMLLHESRSPARISACGDLVPLEDQDRSLWDRAQLAEGLTLVERALAAGPPGPYTLQAAIAAVHARAPHAGATDWPQVIALYGALAQASPSPVIVLTTPPPWTGAPGPPPARP